MKILFMDIPNIKRILMVRTDRIGDVVLSTPAITAMRKAFPGSYIAVMVSPQTKEIIKGNPYVNEIIVYDKALKHKGIFGTLNLSNWLKSKKFDIAFILHSTVRVSLLCFLSGIPRRIGYARGKMDFFLTDKMEYKKSLGEKHESEYTLDILRHAGISAEMSPLVMPVSAENENKIDEILRDNGLKDRKIVVLSPGASDRSRMWPPENFAKAGDILVEKFGVCIVLISGREEVKVGEKVKGLMRNKPIFLCGNTSLGELAALLKKTLLLISNDSGPVHVACAVGTPVISIFSRNKKGINPERWKPLGEKTAVLHKKVGCTECLAHDCKKAFLCLRSVSVEEVAQKAVELLKLTP
ncbi:MAG: lipopolysaccharide heptosyltransferase II [Candidatus Omnitrophica bacterium]|nr:lipopolysaccharide heptosyltransferase II [Candidatus Omnitrophota bacterium]